MAALVAERLASAKAALRAAVERGDPAAAATALFEENEYEARRELLGGAAGTSVFDRRLRERVDWEARAAALVAARAERRRARLLLVVGGLLLALVAAGWAVLIASRG
jgi:hypothetical protein